MRSIQNNNYVNLNEHFYGLNYVITFKDIDKKYYATIDYGQNIIRLNKSLSTKKTFETMCHCIILAIQKNTYLDNELDYKFYKSWTILNYTTLHFLFEKVMKIKKQFSQREKGSVRNNGKYGKC